MHSLREHKLPVNQNNSPFQKGVNQVHKRRHMPRLGTVINIEITKDGGLSEANLIRNFCSGSKQGQEKCNFIVRF